VQATTRVGETIGASARRKPDSADVPQCSPGQKCTPPMSPLSIVLLSLAMSTDAFAAAIGKGTALQKPRWSEALRTGAIFGVIEAITPVIGWALGLTAANYVRASDHWIAFGLLVGLGLRMVYKGLTAPTVQVGERLTRHPFWLLALTGFATSIDAMAVGVGLAFINVNVLPVAAAIGFTTFVAVTAGVMVGRVLGTVAGKWAEVCGGILLTGIGVSILIEHLGVG